MTSKKGLTLIELVIVIGLSGILFSFAGFGLLRSRNVVSLDSVIANLESDIKNQQVNSMNGYVLAGSNSPYYGVKFESTKYTLFHGALFFEGSPGNYVVNLSSDNRFSVINLLNNELLYSSQSGELTNFDPIRNFVTIQNLNTGQQKTLYFNKFGTVYDTN